MTWTDLFSINQKIQLVIDRHNNKEKKIETRISQKFLLLLILFLIYISKVFIKVLKINLLLMFLFFVDD